MRMNAYCIRINITKYKYSFTNKIDIKLKTLAYI